MAQIRKINHIAVAVEDIDRAAAFFVDVLGIPLSDKEDVPEQKTRVAFVQVGEVRIEFVQPLASDSPVGKFLAKRGQGIHHICLETDDIEATLSALAERDVALIDKTPRVGAHQARIAFVHPKSVSGVLTEILEPRHE